MTDEELIREREREYLSLAHAMQSGVAIEMSIRAQPTEPKHLRVGINTAMSDHGALVKLLVEKGVVTQLEYFTAMRDMMREEVRRYEAELSAHLGRPVKLA